MMDWSTVAFGALWIFAAALALAVFSHALWSSRERRSRLSQVLAGPGYQCTLTLAGVIFCLGRAGLSQGGGWLAAWLALAALFAASQARSFWVSWKNGSTPS